MPFSLPWKTFAYVKPLNFDKTSSENCFAKFHANALICALFLVSYLTYWPFENAAQSDYSFPVPLYSYKIEYLVVYMILSFWLKAHEQLLLTFFLPNWSISLITARAGIVLVAVIDIFKVKDLLFLSCRGFTNKGLYLASTKSSSIIILKSSEKKSTKQTCTIFFSSPNCDMSFTEGPLFTH